VTQQVEKTLISQVKEALPDDLALAKKILQEISDKEDLLERVEDGIGERAELSQALEIAQIQIEDLAAKAEKLTQEVTSLNSDKENGNSVTSAISKGEPLSEDAFTAHGAASTADYDEISQECDKLRDEKQDLEDELTLRDEIIASLKDDFQGAHGAPSGNADFDALIEEKNNLSEQLALSLSQLEQATDRDGLVLRVERLTEQIEELQSSLEQSLAQNNHLQNKLDEAKQQAKTTALNNGASHVSHSPGAIFTVLLLVAGMGVLAFYTMTGTGSTNKSGTSTVVTTKAPHVNYLLPVEEIETVSFERLRRQRSDLNSILALRSREQFPDVKTMRKEFKRALESEIPYRRALAQIGGGKFEDSLKSLEAAKEDHKKKEALLAYLVGRASFLAGHMNDAAKQLRKAVEVNPQLVDGWRALGDLYMFQDNVEQARFCYNEALKVDEDDALSHAALGAICSLNDEVRKAISHYKHSVKSNDSLPESWYALGMLYQRAEDFGSAAKALEKAIIFEPENAQTHFALSHCYKILQKPSQSKHHRERAINLGYEPVGSINK